MDYIDRKELKEKREARLTQRVLEKIERFNLREEKKRVREANQRNKRIEPQEISSLRAEAKNRSKNEFKSYYIVYRLSEDRYLIVDDSQLLLGDTVCGRYNQTGRKIQ